MKRAAWKCQVKTCYLERKKNVGRKGRFKGIVHAKQALRPNYDVKGAVRRAQHDMVVLVLVVGSPYL